MRINLRDIKSPLIVVVLIIALVVFDYINLCTETEEIDKTSTVDGDLGSTSYDVNAEDLVVFDYINLCTETEEIDKTSTVDGDLGSTSYDVNAEDLELLSKLIFLEAGIESLESKIAVASVVINRLSSSQWGDTLEEVIYYPNQFTPSSLIASTIPYETDQEYYKKSKEFINRWDECYLAAELVLSEGSQLPSYVLYFRTDYHHNWDGYRGYDVIDNTYFGYLDKDYSGGDASEF